MSEPFDKAELMERVDDDMEFLEETVEMLDEDAPGLIDQIRAAVDAGDAEALTHSAHTLKGMLGNFCAPAAFESARKLEFMGREATLDGAAAGLEEAERLTNELREALRAFIASNS